MIDRNAYYGGAIRTVVSSGNPLNVLPKAARVWTLAGADATCYFQLPDARTLPVADYIYLVSEGFDCPVKDASGTLLFTLLANAAAKLVLTANTTQAGTWRWRAPPVLPTISIPTGFRLRADLGVFDSDIGGSAITVDATAIGRWQDQSTNAFHITAAVAGRRPLWKSGILNGHPVVRWDGTDDALRRTPFDITFLSGSGGSEDQMAIFSVHKVTTAQNQRLISCLDGTNALGVMPAYGDSKLHFYINSTSELNVATPGGYVGNWKTDVYIRNGTSALIRSNSVQIASGTVASGNFGGTGALSVGGIDFGPGAENFAGDSAEIIIYPGIPSAGEITAIENYLRAFWGHY